MIDRNLKKELKERERRLKGNVLHLQVLIEKIYSLERHMVKNPICTDDNNRVFRMCTKQIAEFSEDVKCLSKDIIDNYYLAMNTIQIFQEKHENEIELIRKGEQKAFGQY